MSGLQVLASTSHYWDHAAPIADLIPGSVRVTRPHEADWSQGPVMVCSGEEASRAKGPYIYLEHGSGQVYDRSLRGYPGGHGHERCELFLCPSQRVANAWTDAYPQARAAVIGCPKLDPWHRGERPDPIPRTVVISFHWPCKAAEPWSGTAFAHYAKRMADVVASWRSQGWVVMGHGHPKDAKRLHAFWRGLGVKWIPHFSEVLDWATLYVCDNSSTLMEFASLDRPVVFMSKPAWADGHHSPGGRFGTWSQAGLEVWGPDELIGLQLHDYVTWDGYRSARREVVRMVYSHTDGRCAQRAADAIMEVL